MRGGGVCVRKSSRKEGEAFSVTVTYALRNQAGGDQRGVGRDGIREVDYVLFLDGGWGWGGRVQVSSCFVLIPQFVCEHVTPVLLSLCL